jgi:hypothetical protein
VFSSFFGGMRTREVVLIRDLHTLSEAGIKEIVMIVAVDGKKRAWCDISSLIRDCSC